MKFLVFQHVAREHPGVIADWAREREVELDIVKLWEPKYSIPDPTVYDALVIMGGPMGVYENFPTRDAEVAAIRSVLGKKLIIGFCLGSQLLAYSLGADVHPNIRDGKKLKEIGYYDVELIEAGERDQLLKGFTAPIRKRFFHVIPSQAEGSRANGVVEGDEILRQAQDDGEAGGGGVTHERAPTGVGAQSSRIRRERSPARRRTD